MSINQRIKFIRNEKKLNQTEFSSTIGIKQATLSQIENEVIMPSLDIIKSIINKFETNYDWLIDGIGEMNKQSIENLNVHIVKNNVGKNIGNNNNELKTKKNLMREIKHLKREIFYLKKINEILEKQIKD